MAWILQLATGIWHWASQYARRGWHKLVIYSRAVYSVSAFCFFLFFSTFMLLFFCSGLKKVLSWRNQGQLRAVPQVLDIRGTTVDETDASWARKKILSKVWKRTYKTEKVRGRQSKSDRFFVTWPLDATGKSKLFYCLICRTDVSVLMQHGHEVLRHFQGSKHFPGDPRLRLEIPGWGVPRSEDKSLSLSLSLSLFLSLSLSLSLSCSPSTSWSVRVTASSELS